jgi:hypothetical protein
VTFDEWGGFYDHRGVQPGAAAPGRARRPLRALLHPRAVGPAISPPSESLLTRVVSCRVFDRYRHTEGNNLPMVDVPIYVAIITALAGIVGAAIPQIAIVIRDVRQAERDREERSATATRDACVALLRAAGELRNLAEGWRSYRGEANAVLARVAQVRSLAEATRLHAVNVSMQVPDKLGPPADKVADAASALVDNVVQNTELNQGVVLGDPDVAGLVACIAAFRDEAVSYARN